MSDPKSRLSTRVEVFTRATADALNRAIGEVLDARSPWQLLYRLSRIVFLGLVLYLGWILVVVQPDLARRLMLPPTPRFQERFALHRDPVEEVLQAAVARSANDATRLATARRNFLAAVDRERATGRQEYQDHQVILDRFRDEAQAAWLDDRGGPPGCGRRRGDADRREPLARGEDARPPVAPRGGAGEEPAELAYQFVDPRAGGLDRAGGLG